MSGILGKTDKAAKKPDLYGLSVSKPFKYIVGSFVFTFLVVVLNRHGPESLFYASLAALVWKIRAFFVLVQRRRKLVTALLKNTHLPARSLISTALDCTVFTALGLVYGALAGARLISSAADDSFLAMLLGAYAFADATLVLSIVYTTMRYTALEEEALAQKIRAIPLQTLLSTFAGQIDLEAQTTNTASVDGDGDGDAKLAPAQSAAAPTVPIVTTVLPVPEKMHDTTPPES